MGPVGAPQLGQTPHPPGLPTQSSRNLGAQQPQSMALGWERLGRPREVPADPYNDEKGLWGLSQAHLTTVKRQDGVWDSEEGHCLPALLSSFLAPSRDGRA